MQGKPSISGRGASQGKPDAPEERRPEEEETLRDALRPRGPVRFAMQEVHEPGAAWLQIRGELDVLTIPKLAARLDTLVRRSTDDVVLDLRRAEFIDSAGLQILLSTRRRLERFSRKLTVVCDEGPVRSVIELTRLVEPLGLIWGDELPQGRPQNPV